MLTINPVTSRSRAKDYYSVADYYSEGQETVGDWGGRLAAEWGLSGRVTQEAFDRMVDGRHPLTGGRLTARTDDDRKVGYDFTVSLKKSASLVRAFADEATGRAMDEARDDALAYMMAAVEADMQCRVRKAGADHDVTTGNLIYAAFHHSTARPTPGNPPDMDDHTHILVFNCTRSPDGRLLAGQFGNLKKDGEYYSALFDARYAANLQKLGFALDKSGGKRWEIAGIPDAMIETFSKRKHEVEAEARRLGINDPSRKHGLAATTRSKKQKELTWAELVDAWRSQLTEDDREALAAVYRRELPHGRRITAAEAVAFAARHCFEREAVVGEKELVAVALLYALADVTAEQVRAEFAAHGVLRTEREGREVATTREAYAMERSYIGFAREGRGGVEAAGLPAGLDRGILDDEQWAAVVSLMTSCDRVQLVDSAAGVGKSTMLSVYDRGMKLAGQGVTYLATTTPAVDVLVRDGFAAESLAKFLLSEKMQEAARGGRVVVDESSMMGLRDAYKLFKIAREKDISVVLLGDSRQHASVPAGAVMRTLREYGGIEPIRITQIKRQKNKDHRRAVELLFAGKVLEAFDILDRKLGWVHEIKDAEARYQAMAAAYVDAIKSGVKWDEILLSSPTHAEGRRVVDHARHLLRAEGLIGEEDREFTRWVSADLSEAQRGDARSYRPGTVDMVQFFQNARGHKSGSRVMIKDGPPHLPFDESAKFQAFRREAVQFAEGDIIRFTAGGTTLDGHRIRNGSRYRIAGFTATGIRLDNGWLVANDFGHFKHGIETSHGAQSKTVRLSISGIASQSFGAANSEQEYVDASRARYKALTFTDDKEGLRRVIQRSSLKLAAHDVFAAPPATPAQAAWWKRLAQWSQRALLARNRDDAARASRRPLMPPPPSPRPGPPSHAERAAGSRRGASHGR